MSEVTLYGYSSGPMVTGSLVRYVDAKLLNNDRKIARVRIKQYDLIPAGKELIVDYAVSIPIRGSCYLGLVLLDTWEVQFICDSPLVRCWVGGLDDDLNIQPGNALVHTEFLKFAANSIQVVPRKRKPEVLALGYRQ